MKSKLFMVARMLEVAVIFTHILALTLLVHVRQNSLKGSQMLLLLSLCLTELVYALVNIGKQLCYMSGMTLLGDKLHLFNFTIVYVMYISIMTFITIDRFLEIYLNIKYSIIWSPKKTRTVLIIAFCISFTLMILTLLIGKQNSRFFFIYYFIPISDSIFLIVASVIYFYITKQILKHRRNTKKLQQQLRKNNKIVYQKKSNNRFKIYVPALIIVTFIFFMIGPNFISLLNRQTKIVKLDVEENIVNILIPIGFIADAIIFIFNLKAFRTALKRMINRQKSAILCRQFSN